MRQYPTTGGYFSLTPRQGRMRTPLSAVPSDTTAPAITSVTASAGTYYFVGRTITFTVTFSEAVTVTGMPRIALTIGAATRYATYASGSGTTTLTFTYTFVVGDTDTDGFAATSPMELNSGTIRDAAGNNATLTFSAPDLSLKRALFRGMFLGTDFTQGADAQKLYFTIGSTQISAQTGTRGSGSGAGADDPAWGATGAEFDGGDYFSSIPYTGLMDKIDNPGVYTLMALVYISSNTPKRMTIFTSVGGGADWAAGGTEFALYSDGRVTATNNNALSGTYIMTPDVAWRTEGWHTCAWVSDATTVKFYWDGVLDSHTFTGYGSTTLQTTPANVRIGHGEFGMTNMVGSKMQYFVACNVAHTAAEVAAAHTAMGLGLESLG